MSGKKGQNRQGKPVELEKVFDRVPPQAIEAEIAVLGSILLDWSCMAGVVEVLSFDAFYKPGHQKIYEAALSLYEENVPVDFVTLSDELKKRGTLDDVGGAYCLTGLIGAVPSAANAVFHARIVQEKFLIRRLISESISVVQMCYAGEEDSGGLIDFAERRVLGVASGRFRQGFEHVEPIIHRAVDEIDEFSKRGGAITGISTGFGVVDEITSGLQCSDLIVVAGRPSMGKTAFSLGLARHAAVHQDIPVGIFSLEMSKKQLVLRLLCAEARIDAHGVRTGRLDADGWKRLSGAATRLYKTPIFIDDSSEIGVLELRTKARRLKKENGVGLIVVDYLQLMQGGVGVRGENRQQEISDISRSLKGLAKELDVPVVALSQLSRAVESRGGDKRPLLSDLRESGAIEQDADVVIFIYRPEFYGIEADHAGNSTEGVAEIIVGKQRNGPVGTRLLSFVKQWATFENLTRREEKVPF